MDRLDEELIKLLQEDARQSSIVLAKQLKASPATVRRRVNKLISTGVVRIRAFPDAGKIGLPLAVILAMDVAQEKMAPAMQTLANRQEVSWVSTTTGRFDIIALARFSSTDELSEFIQKVVPSIDGVRDCETFICLQLKRSRYPLI